jgi:hypothetical protein
LQDEKRKEKKRSSRENNRRLRQEGIGTFQVQSHLVSMSSSHDCLTSCVEYEKTCEWQLRRCFGSVGGRVEEVNWPVEVGCEEEEMATRKKRERKVVATRKT